MKRVSILLIGFVECVENVNINKCVQQSDKWPAIIFDLVRFGMHIVHTLYCGNIPYHTVKYTHQPSSKAKKKPQKYFRRMHRNIRLEV